MAGKLPLSVFIIAKDEADRIPIAISSVRDLARDVIVIDSGSRDETAAISQKLGARVLFNRWQGYGPQKVFGEKQCRHDWILNIDADEEVSAELQREIRSLFEQREPDCIAYTVPILPLYIFQERGHPWTAHHHPIRLYHRAHAGFSDQLVHDSVKVRDGRTGRLHGMVVHRSFRSLQHHVAKVNQYSDAQAEDRFLKGRDVSSLGLLFTAPLAFLKSYLLRREFINGLDGIIISYMYAFQRFIRLAKTRERFQIERHKNRRK